VSKTSLEMLLPVTTVTGNLTITVTVTNWVRAPLRAVLNCLQVLTTSQLSWSLDWDSRMLVLRNLKRATGSGPEVRVRVFQVEKKFKLLVHRDWQVASAVTPSLHHRDRNLKGRLPVILRLSRVSVQHVCEIKVRSLAVRYFHFRQRIVMM
jgi:hypothetical protein